MTTLTTTGAATAYTEALSHLHAALDGETLTPGGLTVKVLDSPPISANVLPVAWVEWTQAVTTNTRNVNRVSVRYVVVPDPADNELAELAALTAVDLIDREKWSQPFTASPAQVELGGVTRAAVFVTVQIDYPAVC